MLYNEDSLEFMKRVPVGYYDLIIADPPYNLEEEKKKLYHEEMKRVCSGTILVFCKSENRWQLPCDDTLYWIKPISTKNTKYGYSHFVEEILLYKGCCPIWNPDRHWSQYTNVFTDLVDDNSHPYKKPYSLIRRLLLNHSNPGNKILDPFAGSCTVQHVCHQTDRLCDSVEIDYEICKEANAN